MSQWVNVCKCQRCGQDHALEFKGLLNATDDYTAWTMCPKTNQPLLLKIEWVAREQK